MRYDADTGGAIDVMSIGLQGEHLIFLISQPRSGSTLLQRILGSHPDIHTVSEPWLMLHPLYALRSDGLVTEYDAQPARRALQSFLQMLPGGEDEYIEGVRRMYGYLYERALISPGKRYFLDKTPRYYFVIPELYRVFPQAKYIILWRNPLAVLCSIINIWVKGNWLSLHNYRHDLIRGPRLLLQGVQTLGEHGIVVHYEHLVRAPESEIQRICESLGVEFVSGMVEYGHHDLASWPFGDHEGVYQHTRPAWQTTEKWVEALTDPQVWRLANDYLQLLGQETVEEMGYPYEELQQVLRAHRPQQISLWFTFSLGWWLKKPLEERSRWMRSILRMIGSLRRRGIRGTVVAAMRKLAHVQSNSKETPTPAA